jgi:hypothetical protein
MHGRCMQKKKNRVASRQRYILKTILNGKQEAGVPFKVLNDAKVRSSHLSNYFKGKIRKLSRMRRM